MLVLVETAVMEKGGRREGAKGRERGQPGEGVGGARRGRRHGGRWRHKGCRDDRYDHTGTSDNVGLCGDVLE